MNRREILGKAAGALAALPLTRVARIINGKAVETPEEDASKIETAPGQYLVLVAEASGIALEEIRLPGAATGWVYMVACGCPLSEALRIYKLE